jgi:hypothetical protein
LRMQEPFTATCVYCGREATAEGVVVPKTGRMKGQEIALKLCADHAPNGAIADKARTQRKLAFRRSAARAGSLLRPAWNVTRSRGR